eukprot:1131812-Lingulodinium_polyedra.AAC.1
MDGADRMDPIDSNRIEPKSIEMDRNSSNACTRSEWFDWMEGIESNRSNHFIYPSSHPSIHRPIHPSIEESSLVDGGVESSL